jgi:succinate dehydrogenase / fumarate reductase flavoprotein subunit
MRGIENAYELWQEMGKVMTDHVTVVRVNKNLEETDQKLQELQKRYKNIDIGDVSKWANQSVVFTRQLWNMLQLARVITLGALRRNESRGAHYKPDFPNRDDGKWLKTTVAKYAPNAPEFSYEAVDTSLLKPRERKY